MRLEGAPMADRHTSYGMGWLPDYPSFKDFTLQEQGLAKQQGDVDQSKPVADLVSKVSTEAKDERFGPRADLRPWFSPVENQGNLNSCTAHAAVGLFEYFERKAFGKHIDASRMFLWKVTRNMLHWTGNSGAFLRTAMGALVLFGVPPEEYWPYDPENVDAEPPAFCYAFAQDYQAVTYYRLDPPDTPTDSLLKRVKAELANALPCMFGFTVFRSCLAQSRENGGGIPFPTEKDKIEGGHAVIAAGYDDAITIENADQDGDTTTGALLVRNSWGEEWGESGYGWLPYAYIEKGLAVDWWSLIKGEWVDTEAFGQAQTG